MKTTKDFLTIVLAGVVFTLGAYRFAQAQSIDCTQQQNYVNQLTTNLNNINSDLTTATNNLNACLNAQQTIANVQAVEATPAYQQAVQAQPMTIQTDSPAYNATGVVNLLNQENGT